MLGYTKDDDAVDIALKTLAWLFVTGILFGAYLIYAGFTTMYARDGELVGQAKKLTHVTPLWSSFCPPYYVLDVSMGVLQGGVGSMSTEDLALTVIDVEDLAAMRAAVAHGAIVKIRYDTRRLAACTEDYLATGFEEMPR
jgi:hypothetical protein